MCGLSVQSGSWRMRGRTRNRTEYPADIRTPGTRVHVYPYTLVPVYPCTRGPGQRVCCLLPYISTVSQNSLSTPQASWKGGRREGMLRFRLTRRILRRARGLALRDTHDVCFCCLEDPLTRGEKNHSYCSVGRVNLVLHPKEGKTTDETG